MITGLAVGMIRLHKARARSSMLPRRILASIRLDLRQSYEVHLRGTQRLPEPHTVPLYLPPILLLTKHPWTLHHLPIPLSIPPLPVLTCNPLY